MAGISRECRPLETLDLCDYFGDVTGDDTHQVQRICEVLFSGGLLHLFYVVLLKKYDAHAGIGSTGLVLQQWPAVITFGYCGTSVD